MSIKLYEISAAYQMLLEIDDLEEEYLDSLKDQAEEKLLNLGVVIKTLNAEADAIKAEEKKLSERRKVLENKSESIKRYAFENMKTLNIKNAKSPICSLTIANNPPSLVIEDEKLIPAIYITEKTVYSYENAEIKEKLKNGENVPGAKLIQGQSLRIK